MILVDDSTYTGASFADLVFAYGAGIVDQRFNLSFLSGARRVLLEYDRDGLNFCSVTPGTPSCGSPRVAAINAGFEEYPQGAIPINTDGLNRPLIVLPRLLRRLFGDHQFGEQSPLCFKRRPIQQIAERISGHRVGRWRRSPIRDCPGAPGGGGRHIVRPLRPSLLFVYNQEALDFADRNFRAARFEQVGRLSFTVDLAADSSYNPSAPAALGHNAGSSDIYRSLYNRQQSGKY